MPRKKSVDSASEAGSQKSKKKVVRKKKAEPQAIEEEIVAIPPEGAEEQTVQPNAGSPEAHAQDEVDHFEIRPQEPAIIEPESDSEKSAQAQAPAPTPAAPLETSWTAPGDGRALGDQQPIPHEEDHAADLSAATGELLETSRPEQEDAKPQATMADIKPKQPSDYPTYSELNTERDFLAPEKFSFDLKPGATKSPQQAAKKGWVKTLTYSLIGIAVLAAGSLIFLNYYSQKLAAPTPADQNQGTANQPAQQPAASGAASSVPKLAMANAPTNIVNIISQAAAQNSKLLSFDSKENVSLPASGTDILYIKNANATQTQQIDDFLKNLGIDPQIQQKADISDDYVLYLTAALGNINLGGLTSAVYNSGSTTGLAAKYCTILQKYKITSCNPLNATAKQAEFVVATSNQAAIVKLSRTPEFKNASFTAAAAGQVEDIRVTTNR